MPLSCAAKMPVKSPKHNMDLSQKKISFFNLIKPLANKANQLVSNERKQLLLIERESTLNKSQKQQLNSLCEKYHESINSPALISNLLVKIDTIPTSLLLAQAANESAWGTSRFARLGNNLFGQWCFKQGCGFIPKARSKGKNYEVRRFDSKFDSINAYLLNLNTNRSYKELRNIRAKLSEQQRKVTGIALAKGLLHYSERGANYVKDIISMIKTNNLE